MRHCILIVDDEYGLADLVSDLLEAAGYDTMVASNGLEGLQSIEQNEPDLVVMDVMMPLVDGPEMLQQMRSNPETADIPVIMMTAMPEALPKGDPPPFQASLHKPFAIETLLGQIDHLLDASEEPE